MMTHLMKTICNHIKSMLLSIFKTFTKMIKKQIQKKHKLWVFNRLLNPKFFKISINTKTLLKNKKYYTIKLNNLIYNLILILIKYKMKLIIKNIQMLISLIKNYNNQMMKLIITKIK